MPLVGGFVQGEAFRPSLRLASRVRPTERPLPERGREGASAPFGRSLGYDDVRRERPSTPAWLPKPQDPFHVTSAGRPKERVPVASARCEQGRRHC